MLEEALALAEAGIFVIPLIPRKKTPITEHGVNDATTSLIQIKKWWKKWPEANIGIAVGEKSGIIALDLDFKDGCNPQFPKQIPPTVTAKTPNGGMHPYFKYPSKGIKNGKKLEKGVTVRSTGYYFVAPPSKFEDVGDYSWVSRGLADGEIAECPDWIVEHPGQGIPQVVQVGIGQRHDVLLAKAVHLRKIGRSKDFILKRLVKLNGEFKDGPKPYDEIIRAIEWAFTKVEAVDANKEVVSARYEPNSKQKLTEEQIEALGREILDIRFKLVVNSSTSILYNIKNIAKKEVEICFNEEYLLRRLRKNIIEKIGMISTENFLRKVFTHWRLSTDSIESPSPFSWKSQDKWSFKKLDFEPGKGNFDSWIEFLNRLSAPEDFMAFIWSIFEINSKSRQYLYLFDPYGQGGKSTILTVLGEVFGNSYAAINNSFISGDGSRWLLGNLFGKRLVVWPDCKNTRFCMSELLRNITSGDDVTVEFKGESPFTTKMYIKFILASNHPPSVTGSGADQSRLIRIDVKENSKKNDPEWRERLRQELPHFLFECKYWYDKKCTNHGNIQIEENSQDLASDSTEDTETRFEAIATRYMEFGPELESSINQWVDLCQREKLSNIEVSNFKDYLRQGHNGHDGLILRRVENGRKVSYCSGFKIYDTARVVQVDTTEGLNGHDGHDEFGRCVHPQDRSQ